MRHKIRDSILVVGGGSVFVLFFLLDKVTPKIESSNHGTGGNYGQSKLHQKRKQLKGEANYNPEQKRKQADHSKRRFIKQANYNAQIFTKGMASSRAR